MYIASPIVTFLFVHFHELDSPRQHSKHLEFALICIVYDKVWIKHIKFYQLYEN